MFLGNRVADSRSLAQDVPDIVDTAWMNKCTFLSIAIALDDQRAQESHDFLRMVIKWLHAAAAVYFRYTGTYFTLACPSEVWGIHEAHSEFNRSVGYPGWSQCIQLWLVSWTLYEPRFSLPLSTISFSFTFSCLKSARSDG